MNNVRTLHWWYDHLTYHHKAHKRKKKEHWMLEIKNRFRTAENNNILEVSDWGQLLKLGCSGLRKLWREL